MAGSESGWRRSSFCAGNGSCIEVAMGETWVRIRVCSDLQTELLMATRAEWDAFVAGVKAGEFDD